MNPREKRLLKLLVEKERAFVKDLRSTIGAQNPAQNTLNLRRKGWNIQTGYIELLDRDGRKCRPGFYFLSKDEKNKAKEFLEESERAVAPAPSEEDDSRNRSINHTNLVISQKEKKEGKK